MPRASICAAVWADTTAVFDQMAAWPALAADECVGKSLSGTAYELAIKNIAIYACITCTKARFY